MININLSNAFKHIYNNRKEINERIEKLIEKWEIEDEGK